MKVILASQSPRRRELLEMLGIGFEVKVSEVEEMLTSTDPAKVTEELSCQKAAAVAEQIEEGIVIGADTVVELEHQILGKPLDREDAKHMIGALQGKAHHVYTGVTVIVKKAGKEIGRSVFSEKTVVRVAALSEQEIEEYILSPEPYDKAGGYGIQGAFAKHIQGIQGDYFNVVGLPIHRLYQVLKQYL